jgi:hypothetical protein
MTFYEGSNPSVTAKKSIFMATMVRPKPGGVFTPPFFFLVWAPLNGLWMCDQALFGTEPVGHGVSAG